MNDRRDTRTDAEREADEQREREFHAERARNGLPPLGTVEVTLTLRDCTEEEADAFNRGMADAATSASVEIAEPPTGASRDRGPHFSGGSWTWNPSPYAPPVEEGGADA